MNQLTPHQRDVQTAHLYGRRIGHHEGKREQAYLLPMGISIGLVMAYLSVAIIWWLS